MKRIIGMQFLFCSLVTVIGAAIKEQSASSNIPDYAKPGDYGLEVFNKTERPVWYAIKNGNEFSKLFENKAIAGTKSAKQYTVDLGQDTKLALWFTRPKDEIQPRGSSDLAFSPDPDKVYRFAKGKTMYVTVDPSKTIRPETGPLKGLTKKTDTGLSLKNNVTSSDITTIK
jgi:uncharacterized protein YgiM (DUF1202 family)